MKQAAPQRREVATFRAVRLENPKGFDPASEFVVCPWGTHPTSLGPVTVNERTAQVFEANQIASRRDAVAADFNHETLKGVEPVKVAGFFKVRVVPGKGIVAALSHETPHMQYVRDGNYPDISPAVERDAAGVVEGLHSFAFVRHGKIKHPDLEIFSVEIAAGEAARMSAEAPSQTTAPNTPMSDSEMLAELLSLLTGETIAADASPETKAAALAKAKAAAANPAPETKPADPAPMSAEPTELTKAITALTAEVGTLKTEVSAFKAGEETRKVDALIAEATRQGKKIGLKPERLAAMGAEGAKEYLDTLEAGVVKPDPNAAVKTATAGKGQKVTDVFSAEIIAMWRRQGIDPAAMLKEHNANVAAMSADPDAEPEPEPAAETAAA